MHQMIQVKFMFRQQLYVSFNFIRARNFKCVTNIANMKHFKTHYRYGQLNDFAFIEMYDSIELKHLLMQNSHIQSTSG